MGRRQKILKHISKEGIGVEIGPSHKPIAAKGKGYNVHIIDHMSREQLLEKYANQNLYLDNIEDVDYVWKGESYTKLTGKNKFYDWIIASHVIEHTPDLIGFLNDCDSIMKDDGVISLVIPDKRYCFDHFRPISGLSKIIDSHLNHQRNHSPGTVAEYFLNVVSSDGQIAWEPGFRGIYEFVHTQEEAINHMNLVSEEGDYVDVHSWCFTPHSFRLMIHDLYNLGFISFKEVDFYPTAGCEFYITLGRQGKPEQLSRLEMLKNIESEIMTYSIQETTVLSKFIGVKVRLKKSVKSIIKFFRSI